MVVDESLFSRASERGSGERRSKNDSAMMRDQKSSVANVQDSLHWKIYFRRHATTVTAAQLDGGARSPTIFEKQVRTLAYPINENGHGSRPQGNPWCSHPVKEPIICDVSDRVAGMSSNRGRLFRDTLAAKLDEKTRPYVQELLLVPERESKTLRIFCEGKSAS